MYQGFYRLKDHPFRLTPDPAYLCMTAQHREALSGIVYNICTRPGLMVLVGEAGTGKTTLLHSVSDLLQKRNFILARCNNPTLTREEFYDLLLTELGVECSSSLKSRQLKALEENLQRKRDAGWLAVLIVDEAQRLPVELLEEIRLLLNMETPREKLLQIIMAGQPELSVTLASPELRQLKQRVSAICRLSPLSIEELREYIRHRLSLAGLLDQRLFPEDVIDLIFRYTQGIPRLVNSLCDGALQTGFALQSQRITPDIIREVAGDLELSDAGAALARTAVAAAHPEPVAYPEVKPLHADVKPLHAEVKPTHAEVRPTHAEVKPVYAEAKPVHAEVKPVYAEVKPVYAEVKPVPVVKPGPVVVAEPPPPVTRPSNGVNGKGKVDPRIPLEGYSSRHKGLGFFGQLLDRWK